LGLSLLDWLERAALPEEVRMADAAYAIDTARRFVGALAAHGTTTALVFGSHFPAATASLFEAGAEAGVRVVSGLVLSDRALHPQLHRTPDDAYRESTALIDRFHGKRRLRYAVTPRFALSTSEAMLEVCQTLVREHDTVVVQSHINENRDEVAVVAGAFPWARDYLAVYERYALTGPRAVLAHNVLATDGELERLGATGTSVAHCPCSNAALGSGMFPLRRHRAHGVHVALGTDVGGGVGFGMLKEALQAHLMQRVAADGVVLDAAQMLYLATLAGARALRLDDEIGSLCPGKAADFVYLRPPGGSVLEAVLQRASSREAALSAFFTLAGAECVREVRVDGVRIHPS
jgi:guanine deaminase